MNMESITEAIRSSFASRNFTPMVALFAEEGVYETPYAEAPNRWQGIEAIRARFRQVSDSGWNKAVTIESVTVRSTA